MMFYFGDIDHILCEKNQKFNPFMKAKSSLKGVFF